MCGIFGVIGNSGEGKLPLDATVSLQSAVIATGLLKHRGPDAQALMVIAEGQAVVKTLCQWRDELAEKNENRQTASAYLGHTRLKIVDLSDYANQPFYYRAPSGKAYWVVFNGEIYNYRALKSDLSARGYLFHTGADTELLPALWDAYGDTMPAMLNGMFAFVMWEEGSDGFLMARDRTGIKPLYITRLAGGELAFASEVKSLLALPAVSKTLDRQAIFEHFTFQWSLEQKTLLASIKAFPPGHVGVFNSQTMTLKTRAYWQMPNDSLALDNNLINQKKIGDDLYQLFENAVQSQLTADRPIGCFLSGGMDTGSIAAFASRQIPHLYTLTCGFETIGLPEYERLFDERLQASLMAKTLGTDHHEALITQATLPEVFDATVWHLDDFQAGISYQNYVISQLVKQHVTVVLSGVGADELLGGYPWRYAPLLDLPQTQFSSHYYQAWVRLLSDESKRALFHDDFLHALGDYRTQDVFDAELCKMEGHSSLDKALRFDTKHFLGALLSVEDRLSMAHAVESRVPFLDNALVDYCFTLPDWAKLQVEGNGVIGKYSFRKAMAAVLPPSITQGIKQGFTPPDASWYRGTLREWVSQRLLSERALARNLFKPEALRKILEDHFSGAQNHRFLIWSLLCLESWQSQLIDPI